MLFGVVIDAPALDACDRVMDCLDQAEVPDEDWDWLVWHRRGRTYLLLHAPMLVRATLVDADLAVSPVGVIAEGMQDNRNEWIEPSSARRHSAPRVAAERLEHWQDQQWSDGSDEERARERPAVQVSLEGREQRPAKPSGPVTRTPSRGGRPGRPEESAGTRAAPKLAEPSREVLMAFGMLDARDSEGQAYTIGHLTLDDDDLDEEYQGANA